jgi:hypothetical protein
VALDTDGLIEIRRPVGDVAEIRDQPRSKVLAVQEQDRADQARVVPLHRQDPGGRLDDRLVVQEPRGAFVRRDVDVFEHEGALPEADLVGERIEHLSRADQSRQTGRGREALLEVDGRAGHRSRSQRGAQEPDVSDLVECDLLREIPECRRLERNARSALDIALVAGARHIGAVQSGPKDGPAVELGSQILDVESKVEDVDVARRQLLVLQVHVQRSGRRSQS